MNSRSGQVTPGVAPSSFPPPSRYLLPPLMMESEAVVRLRQELAQSGSRPSLPLIVAWIISTRCQIRCRHCWARPEDVPEPSPHTRLHIARELALAGVCRVVLSGGEPTLAPELAQCLRIFAETGTPVSMYTNALDPLGNSEAPSWLDEWDPERNYVQISMDGGDRKTFEAQRGKGTFAPFLRGVETMRRYGVRLLAHFIATPFNTADVHGAARMALETGCEGFIAEMFYPAGRARSITIRRTIETAKAFNASVEALLNDRRIIASPLKLGICFPVETSFPEYVRAALPRQEISLRQPLELGRYSCVVDFTGQVYPDSLMQDRAGYACGSLLETDLRTCWEQGAGFRALPRERDLSHSSCALCEDFFFCRGGLAVRAWEQSGTFDTHDPHCHLHSRETADRRKP